MERRIFYLLVPLVLMLAFGCGGEPQGAAEEGAVRLAHIRVPDVSQEASRISLKAISLPASLTKSREELSAGFSGPSGGATGADLSQIGVSSGEGRVRAARREQQGD